MLVAIGELVLGAVLLTGTIADYDGTKAKALYLENCGTCHQPDGAGVPFMQPALIDGERVSDADPDKVIEIILKGSDAVEPGSSDYENEMPRFEILSDEEIALITSYVRRSFGGHATDNTSASAVAKQRGTP